MIIEYVCNVCGTKNINPKTMQQIKGIVADRTLHACQICKIQNFTDKSQFLSLNEYDKITG